MALHLIKLSVGSESVDDLQAWQDRLSVAASSAPFHDTRMFPKRDKEIAGKGSIYWVIRRKIRVRQGITALESLTDEAGKRFCRIHLDPLLVPTELKVKRPFQGWRYLEPGAAPPDLGARLLGSPVSVSEGLERALKDACVW